MFGTKLNYDSRLFLEGEEVSGINTVDFSYSNSVNTINPLGFSDGVTTINGETQQNFSFTRDLVYKSVVASGVGGSSSFTGSNNLSGSIHYNGESYGFQSGYLNNWSINCAVGAPIKENCSFVVYDEMRSGASASGSATAPSLSIPSQGSITATCDNSTTNRVIGFDYAVTCNRKPYYSIGNKEPTEVKFIPPLNITAAVQIEVDDAFLESGRNFLETGKSSRTVNLKVDGRNGGPTLVDASVPNACLVSESLSASSDGSLRLTLNYMGHITTT
tara:strand:+ start:120 stop:941 length:822 start_codon:yes stop_codon:yes gene_type:complete